MSDPVGLIGAAGGGGIHGPGGIGGAGGVGRAPGDGAQGPSFKQILLDNIEQVNKLQQEAEVAIEDIATGRRDDLEGVLLATQKADVAFQTLLALRNKVHQAFEEIKQIRV